jgi:hypothetical protein
MGLKEIKKGWYDFLVAKFSLALGLPLRLTVKCKTDFRFCSDTTKTENVARQGLFTSPSFLFLK